MLNNCNRHDISIGMKVAIVQKQHQRTGELTEGIVKEILTNSHYHWRGIKVKIYSPNYNFLVVGRVQKILDNQ